MVQWSQLFSPSPPSRNHHHLRAELRQLLPTTRNDGIPSAYPPAEVTKVALRLKYQIERVVPCELELSKITRANSPVITRKVMSTAREAGGKEYEGCVVYCLLVCKRWFKQQARLEPWDAEMHGARATACEVLAKHLIETATDQDRLFQATLLKRYSTLNRSVPTPPSNVVETAVDQHALRIIASAGYQRCIAYLWRGWLVQDEANPANFVPWRDRATTAYWPHFDPDRMRAPVYQNAVQIFFSLLFLALYTVAINTINRSGDLDTVEGVLYVMTAGFVFDEASKLWKVGRHYVGFWNVFNSTLYALLTTSFITRMVALGHPAGAEERLRFNRLSYNFLAFSAPMFWMRLLLYLDTFRFFGAMMVVLKVMMRESLVFFALLVIVMVGFLQAFVGMDQADDSKQVTSFIVQSMVNAVMQSPNFDGFENFAPPFGIILYYLFTFVVMVVLLNILIALYNSAYSDITDNAIDEYMALFSQKTMQFVRAPDENVFIAPFNLIEIFFLILPFEWWMPKDRYERLNNFIMGVIYSPLLLITAHLETKQAYEVKHNRRRGEQDDDTVEEWEQMQGDIDLEAEGWTKKVERTKPNVETDAAVLEVREMKEKMGKLVELVEGTKVDINGSP
ncbi:Polycystin cation channel, PKD1/PKD2 [Lasallia pustulata]|uniref:Polycystin cation channel, PKD1/PKD2 n=1 Tax=Lasallia pustulata TaxID=136370 RepID=A0A1W5D048_9LECA|nr:Polycystin cation channel, PKD1/PKD2 [Lasallia pustulata]